MDDDSKFGTLIKGALAATGLGAIAAGFTIPFPYGLYVALLILILAALLFGGYFLWRRMHVRREREQFTAAIETQTAAAPKGISDPNRRADLDRVRQKFQTGLQEFKSRGKDLYKLPWYVIIGESGSGKTEAIRHSGIDFPPGLQDELQGSGGTVNMDWWFTNRGIILDTAGSMLFNELHAGEAPEWREFLRLLKRARPHCPVNGLFLVLSVESLIRDSADVIAQKASRLAQQLDIIQRVLDVRFPVYLLVTKCDLLVGFREFFDSIDDPLLQHQMFGWSNPEPLDSHFRPELVEQHLRTVAARLRRRRMALVRDLSGTGRLGDTQQFFAATYQLGRGPTTPTRRLDEVDAMFALPESVMRLAPRLQRYLETVFVAGEWSAKPVFLRGIYFTSSMREGKALDEAIALATGLPLDQLPEERSWEKNRAFFLRDLFHDKVFRESGLVTRATNTLKLLRQRQVAIFGSAGAALLLVLLLASLANHKLKQSVRAEAGYWKTAATHVKGGVWSPAIVSDSPVDGVRYAFQGSNTVPVGSAQPTLIEFNQTLARIAATNLPVSIIFKPMVWLGFGEVRDRAEAQRRVFELSVVDPLVNRVQAKLRTAAPAPGISLERHRDALLSLMELEADGLGAGHGSFSTPGAPARFLKTFISYLTESDFSPSPALGDIFERTYSPDGLRKNHGTWPPASLLGGSLLASNTALSIGLENFDKISRTAQTNIDNQLSRVNDLTDKLLTYQLLERDWLTNTTQNCPLPDTLVSAKAQVDASWTALRGANSPSLAPLSNLALFYTNLASAGSNASASSLAAPVRLIMLRLPASEQGRGLFKEINDRLSTLASGATANIWAGYKQRAPSITSLDIAYLQVPTNSALPSFQIRWSLYTNACALASGVVHPDPSVLGEQWTQYTRLKETAAQFRNTLTAYHGPFHEPVSNICDRVAHQAEETLQNQYVEDYVKVALGQLQSLSQPGPQDTVGLTNAAAWLAKVERDLAACPTRLSQPAKLDPVRTALENARHDILVAFRNNLRASARFPLVLDNASGASLSVSDLASLRKRLGGVTAALQDPVWQADHSGALSGVTAFCSSAVGVVNSLVKEDGSAAAWDLYFVPPSDAAQDDKAIISVFRVAQGSIGKKITDLTALDRNDPNACLLGTVPMNAPLTISFNKFADAATPDKSWSPPSASDWALLRLIQAGQAKRSDDGTHWTFQVPLSDGSLNGKVTFEARLDAHQPLPKSEDWPK
jgi:hypothetical protein